MVILQGVTQVYLTTCEALEIIKGQKSILPKDSLGLGLDQTHRHMF